MLFCGGAQPRQAPHSALLARLPAHLQPRVRSFPGPARPAAPMATSNGSPETQPARVYERLVSLRDLPASYGGALLDQFGVLHDGTQPYPGAIEAVRYLADRGMKLLIISNSSRRSAGALGNLERMGFPKDAFCGVITSGEVTHRALSERATPFWSARRRCLHFTWGARGAISLDGLGLEVVQDHTEADFILAHGTEALGGDVSGAAAEAVPLDRLRALLEACATRSAETGVPIPMVVANPDVVTVHGAELRTMPGTLARWYAEAGGEVHLMGKPAAIIYKGAMEMLGLPDREIIAIGDSLEHDIAGAAAAGVNSLFIAGGIHAKELGVGGPEAPGWGAGGAEEEARLAALCEGFDAHPRYCTPYFSL